MTEPALAAVPWPTEQVLGLASCLCREFDDLCFCGVLAGAFPVLDYCQACEGGNCGQAWVRLVTVLPTADTTGGVAFNPCNTPLEATIEVGVARCAPGPDDDGDAPTMADQLSAAALQIEDMSKALRAIRCCDAYGSRDFTIVQWQPFGPEGGCMGGAWAITLYGG